MGEVQWGMEGRKALQTDGGLLQRNLHEAILKIHSAGMEEFDTRDAVSAGDDS